MRASNFIYLFFVITIIFSNPYSITADAKESQRVLILRFDNSFAPGPSKTQTQLVKTLLEKSSEKILIDVEYLDLFRYNDEQHQKNLIDLLEHKYLSVQFDLIITIGSLALEMVLTHDADIFRRSPVVFCLFQPNLPGTYKNPSDTTGLMAKGHHNSIQKTLELSLELQPEVNNIIVIAGVDKWSRNLLKIAKGISRPYEKKYRFLWLTDKTMDELIQTVSTPLKKTIILYLSVIKDTAGNKYIPVHACRMIAQAAKAPVYALWSGTIGAGAIGGYVLSGEKIGKQTADMCLKILNGEKPSNIPIERYEDAYMFDWRQIKRWSIPEDRLPPDSIVKFKELTVWVRYRWQIIGAIGLIIFQTLIILLLLHQRRLRRQTEYELKDRLQFERKLSELSSEFINLTSESIDIDSKMIDALAWIGPFMRADRSHIFRFNWDRTEFRITHLWETEGVKKDGIVSPGLIVKDAFPWLFENLIGGRDVIVPDIEMLSTLEAGNEYRYCRELGIQSFIILPIEIENAPLCAIGIDSIHQKRDWPQEVQDRLRIIGDIFANTIVRRHADKKSEVAALRYRTVADFTFDWEYWQNPDGSFQYVSPSCDRICGYSAQDLMANPSWLRDMIVPEDKATWDEHRCSIQKEKPSVEIQFRIQRPDGEIRWIEHACQPVFDDQANYQGVRASNRDITKREFYKSETHQLQTELAHMDRVVTISTLTSALAHEINQPLAAMRSYAQAALRFMDKDDPEYDNVRKALRGIVADNKRAAAVVNRLRDLVKKGPTHWETIEINSIINDVIGLINSELVLRKASITLNLQPSIPGVQGDPVQMQQVLINLLMNALDAMDDQPIDARTIVISTRPENSNQILILISDSGGGIPPDTIEAIFSPFHTTKSSGMGLGLSICKSIVEAHGGIIFAENNPDGGATFSLKLPLIRK